MIDQTTAAKAEIDALRAANNTWRDVDKHAAALSAQAQPLARVLRRAETKATIASYVAASASANAAQKRQRGVGGNAAWFGFAATVVSGLLLFLQLIQGSWESTALNVVHVVFVGAALLSALFLKVRKPNDAWGQARTRSEDTRLAHFKSILDAEPHAQPIAAGELPFKVLALEYVRAYLIEDQRDWHRGKIQDTSWPVRGIALLRGLAVLLLIAAMTPVISHMLMSSTVAVLPSIVAKWAGIVKSWMAPERAALAGVFGGALQTLATNLAGLSLAERNHRAYARVSGLLTHYLGAPLDAARIAAAANDDRRVERYWWAVQAELMAENRAWNEALGLSSAYVLDDLPRSRGSSWT